MRSIVENATTTQTGHHVFVGRPPRGITFDHCSGRVISSVRSLITNTCVVIQITAIVLYFHPRKCTTKTLTGRICGRRHRTVYDFCDAHPNYDPNAVHIGHNCHHAPCFNPAHLIMEPASVNLSRNRCRRECICSGIPPCFTNSE